MREVRRIVIPFGKREPVRSLCWSGDDLVDWAAGGVRYHLDGTSSDRSVHYAYHFDRAITSSDGRFQVIYENLGTKGLVLEQGRIVREVDRSYYFANAYDYPICLFRAADGRHLLAHCPDEYNELQIEDAKTGERLTSRTGKDCDFFHSRLRVSADSRYLLSAGWIWHPLDFVHVYEIAAVLADPTLLAGDGLALDVLRNTGGFLCEIHEAAFVGDDRLVLASNQEDSSTIALSIIDLPSLAQVSSQVISGPAGTLMPVAEQVVCFHQHPRLIDMRSGRVVGEWPELPSGMQNSSIVDHHEPPPPMALDPQRRRFAVAGPEALTVIELGD